MAPQGLLVTDWGDMGHLQQPPVSDPGFATAAAFGWCVDAHAGLGPTAALAGLLDAHCYGDVAGRVGPGRRRPGPGVAGWSTPQPPNMSALALHILLPQWNVGRALTDGLQAGELDAVEARLD